MYLFYTPDIAVSSTLGATESAHAIRVLRLKVGDKFLATDGRGGVFCCVITNGNVRACDFEVVEQVATAHQRNYRVHIAIAPTKNIDRMEWAVEKCTEIGVDSITPLLCRYSERKELKIDRLHNIIVSACKQSLKSQFPILNTMTKFDDFVRHSQEQQKFIAHCYEEQKQQLVSLVQPKTDVVVLIGPEGDFSHEEVNLAQQCGFQPVALGNERLRTETAAIAACHTISLINIMN